MISFNMEIYLMKYKFSREKSVFVSRSSNLYSFIPNGYLTNNKFLLLDQTYSVRVSVDS